MTTKTWSRNMGQLAIDPNQSGLVTGYDMIPRADGTIEDKSGNGNHGTINGPGFEFTEIGPSMKFDGSKDQTIECGAGCQALTDVTVSGWVKTSGIDASTVFPALFSYYLNSSDNWGVILRDLAGVVNIAINDDIDNANVFRYSTVFPLNVWNHFAAQLDSLENKLYLNGTLVGSGILASDDWSSFAGDFVLGNRQGLPDVSAVSYRFGGNMASIRVLNRVCTATEIQAEYLKGANAVNFKTDYGVSESAAAESAPGELSNSPARVISGTYKISTETIDGCTAKVVECVTAGVVAIPTAYFHGNDTQAAYGTFEWWMLQGLAANFLRVSFISNQATSVNTAGFDGYVIRFSNDQRYQLIRRDNAAPSIIQSTDSAKITPGEYYKCKISRSSSGSFSLYLNGVFITDLVIGTNPITDTTHTASKYIVLDLDAGDKVGWSAKNGSCAIVKYEGII